MDVQTLAHMCLTAFHIREASRAGGSGLHSMTFRQAAERACRNAGFEDLIAVIEVMATDFETCEWSRRITAVELGC